MNAEKLQKYYGYKSLNIKRAFHTAYEKACEVKPTYTMIDPNILFGVEIEVENVGVHPELDYYWTATNDGSLRNNGLEFVSIPLRGHQVEYALDYLSKNLAGTDLVFSPRTSVHVHMNVRDFTWDQVKVFTLLYAIFEKHFFHVVGSVRESNIFCVPLYKSDQLDKILQLETEIKWHKYNALNLTPIYGDTGEGLKPQGTIEFRHLYGTLDKKIIIDWINTISLLRKFALTQTLTEVLEKIRNMNTTSEYIALYNTIFGDFANIHRMSKYDFESCVSNVKVALWGKTLNQQYYVKENSKYYRTKYNMENLVINPKTILKNTLFKPVHF